MSVTESTRPFRLAILASHPIQYQAPLFRALAKRTEFDLTVFFCSDWGIKTYRDEGFGQELKWDIPLLDGYRSEFLPNVSPKPNSSKFWGLINPAIVRRVRNGSFDAVLIQGWARFTDWLCLCTAFISGIHVLLRGDTNLLPTLPQWKSVIKRAVLTRIFERVSAFLAIGRFNARFYEAYGVPKEKIFHVPYAVNNDFFISKANELFPKKIELKKKFGIPENLPVILFTGKLTSVKRPMDLLQAYADLSKEIKCALIFVGNGPLRDQLEAYMEEQDLQHVYFTGFQNQTELSRFYIIADIFVLPSGFEPWGLVINEAMCFSLPIIVSDQVGARGDLVCEGLNGFAYSTGDVMALASRLKLLLTDETLRVKMGDASFKIIKDWSVYENVNGCLRIMRSLQVEETE
jgi:glycosyltransferase involved in cell wall biosynthesis